MERSLAGCLSRITDTFSRYRNTIFENTKSEAAENEDEALIKSVRQAMREWSTAQQFFESVSEPELVDYAVYSLEASRKKYMYLLKKARDKGIRIDCY